MVTIIHLDQEICVTPCCCESQLSLTMEICYHFFFHRVFKQLCHFKGPTYLNCYLMWGEQVFNVSLDPTVSLHDLPVTVQYKIKLLKHFLFVLLKFYVAYVCRYCGLELFVVDFSVT